MSGDTFDLSREAAKIIKTMNNFMRANLMRRPRRDFAEPDENCLPWRKQTAEALRRRGLILRPSGASGIFPVTKLGKEARRLIALADPFNYPPEAQP